MLWAGYLLARHPKSQRHNETLGASEAVNGFHFESNSRVWDGCTRSWCAAKDGNVWELVEIICLAFFLQGYHHLGAVLNRLLFFFPTLKRREDLGRKQKGAEGYFAEGKIFLLHWRFCCWEEGDRRNRQQWSCGGTRLPPYCHRGK